MVLFVFDYHWYDINWWTALLYSFKEVLSYAILFYSSLLIFDQLKQRPIILGVVLLAFIVAYIMILRISGLEEYLYDLSGMRNVFSMSLNAILFCGLAVFLGLYRDAEKLQRKNFELAQLNKKLELTNLKNRINPHFIFNTLNNLNALILKKDKQLPEFVNEFSTLLRYSVDDGTKEEIPLEKELRCVRAYFDLLEMNKPASENIDFYVEGNASDKKIAPFIITSMVENAIKHSDINYNEEGHIHCHISCEEELIEMHLSNSYDEKDRQVDGKGIGMIERQLELRYEKGYSLEIQTENSTYVVRLVISSPKIRAL